jgi:hypothetical protein
VSPFGRQRTPRWQDYIRSQADQILRERRYPIGVIAVPSNVHSHVATIDPTQVRKRFSECRETRLIHGIVFVARHEHANAPHAVALLRLRRERPLAEKAAIGAIEGWGTAEDAAVTRAPRGLRPQACL